MGAIVGLAVDDPLVRLDRRGRIENYLPAASRLIYPELMHTGPTEYDVRRLVLKTYPDQGACSGSKFARRLEDEGLVPKCLGIFDLRAIQGRGLAFYRHHFGDSHIFGWKSSVVAPASMYGGLKVVHVPYLVETQDRIWLRWYELLRLYTEVKAVAAHFPDELLAG